MTATAAADKLIATKVQGTYLVRFSASSFGSFVVSVLDDNVAKNYTIYRRDGKYGLQPTGQQYGSIPELLANEGVKMCASQFLPVQRPPGPPVYL